MPWIYKKHMGKQMAWSNDWLKVSSDCTLFPANGITPMRHILLKMNNSVLSEGGAYAENKWAKAMHLELSK